MKVGRKTVYLVAGVEEGSEWNLHINVYPGSANFQGNFALGIKRDKVKALQRQKDKNWVIWNIPSSIWWHMEIHHDWEAGGVMYLLTHKEHLERHRK